jgi:hypothetical protein
VNGISQRRVNCRSLAGREIKKDINDV